MRRLQPEVEEFLNSAKRLQHATEEELFQSGLDQTHGD